MSLEVTIFKNIRDIDTPHFKDVYYILNRIKEGTSANLVKRIRKEKDKSARKELKKELTDISLRGKFNKGADNNIQHQSGLVC